MDEFTPTNAAVKSAYLLRNSNVFPTDVISTRPSFPATADGVAVPRVTVKVDLEE